MKKIFIALLILIIFAVGMITSSLLIAHAYPELPVTEVPIQIVMKGDTVQSVKKQIPNTNVEGDLTIGKQISPELPTKIFTVKVTAGESLSCNATSEPFTRTYSIQYPEGTFKIKNAPVSVLGYDYPVKVWVKTEKGSYRMVSDGHNNFTIAQPLIASQVTFRIEQGCKGYIVTNPSTWDIREITYNQKAVIE